MKFKFRLMTLLRHKKRLRDEAMKAFAEAQAEVNEKLSEIDYLFSIITESRNYAHGFEKQAAFKTTIHEYTDAYIRGVKRQIEESRLQARELMLVMEEKQEALIEATREVKSIEKLRDKQKERFLKEKKKKENKLVDENVMVRVGRSWT